MFEKEKYFFQDEEVSSNSTINKIKKNCKSYTVYRLNHFFILSYEIALLYITLATFLY